MAGLIFLWQTSAPVTPPPVIDVGIGLLDETAAPAKRHRGHGRTVLEPVVGFGTGRARRRSVPGFSVLSSFGLQGCGHVRRSGCGHLTLSDLDLDGQGRRRRTGHGSLALVLLRANDRDALIALAAHAGD